MASPLELAAYVQQQGQLGRQQGTNTRLNRLAGLSYEAPQAERAGLLGQMAQSDRGAAIQQQGALGKMDEQSGSRLAQKARVFVGFAKAGNQEAINAMYPQLAQEAQSLGFGNIPMQYDPSFLPGLEQLANAGSASASGVQSTFVDDQGQRVAIMRDGSTRVLGGNDSGMSQQTVTINGPDGRPAQYTFDKRTGNYVPASFGGQSSAMGAPPPQQYGGMSNVQYRTDDGQQIPPEEQAIAQQAMLAASRGHTFDMPVRAPGGQPVQQQLPPALDYGRGGTQSPFVGQSPAEKAAAETAARQQAELAYLPERQRIETQGAVDRTRGTEQAKSEIERSKGQGKAKLSLDQATARLARVDSLVDSIMPRIGYGTAGWAGSALSNVPGTEAADLRRDLGTLQAIAGFDELNAMRAASPTGGALGNVTERELAFLQSVVRNIENSQSPEQLRRNLTDFQRELRGSWERVNQAYQQDYGSGQSSREAPQAGAVQDGYRFRGGNPADPNSWERI